MGETLEMLLSTIHAAAISDERTAWRGPAIRRAHKPLQEGCACSKGVDPLCQQLQLWPPLHVDNRYMGWGLLCPHANGI